MDITVALGGGGAKGNSHIGVLRRLEKEGYEIRSIAGTSFGGLVAILYASGRTPDEIEEIFSSTDQTNLYGRDRNDGFLPGKQSWMICNARSSLSQRKTGTITDPLEI